MNITFAFTDYTEHDYERTLVNMATGELISFKNADDYDSETGTYKLNLKDLIGIVAGYYKLTIADKMDESVVDNMYFRLYDKSSFNMVLSADAMLEYATDNRPAVIRASATSVWASFVYNSYKAGSKINIVGYYIIERTNGQTDYLQAIDSISGGSSEINGNQIIYDDIVFDFSHTIYSGESYIINLVAGEDFALDIKRLKLVLVNVTENYKIVSEVEVRR